MSVIAMLAILWWGIIGFLGFCLAIWGVIQSCKDGHWMSDRQAGLANLKHRDRWLLEFFGEAGRERWLANERRRHLSEGNWEYATQDARELAKRAKRDAKIKRQRDGELAKDRYAFSKPRRTADGRCVGMVRDPSRSLSEYSWNPPWGDDWREYHVVRVPRACDWLAAGFWDPFVYKGSTIDPVAMVHQEMVMG